MDQILCCYCGVKVATTRDHIPPKGIFIKPRPNDLITVPSCLTCNNGASGYDEKFKVYLGMHIARFRNKGETLFKEGVLPTVRHNQSLRKKILNSFERISLIDREGMKIKDTIAVLWDSDAHDHVIERITKGLFYHHFQKPVSEASGIEVYWFNSFPDIDFDSLYKESIGNDDFVYYYNKLDGCDDSIWLYQFYSGHWSGAMITCATEK